MLRNLKMIAMVEMVNLEVMEIHGHLEEAMGKVLTCLFMKRDKRDPLRFLLLPKKLPKARINFSMMLKRKNTIN
jgi:hypothetical protein